MLLKLLNDGKGLSCRVDKCLFILSRYYMDHNEVNELVNSEREYMITGGMRNHPRGFYVEPVTSDYDLVSHKGFELSGTMRQTIAVSNVGIITPGRIMNLVHVADNLNLADNPPVPVQAGQVYVRKGEARAAGLSHLDEGVLSRQEAFTKVQQAARAVDIQPDGQSPIPASGTFQPILMRD